MYSRQAASSCLPVDANGPVFGMISAIFSGSAARAMCGNDSAAAPAAVWARKVRRVIVPVAHLVAPEGFGG
jgi:hypothetical protein